MGLLEIINDILDISKIQSDRLSLDPIHYDFNSMINNIESIAHFLAENKSISFKMTITGKKPECLYGDDNRLRQVLLNLLNNAVKFTEKGSVNLDINITDKNLEFSVRDTGIGIKPEDIPTIFDLFIRVDMHRNRSKEGTGLGLSITKSLIEMMGGLITVRSVYGEGTVFRFVIPKIPGDKALMKHQEETEYEISAPEAKVLVVDDNTINLNVAFGLLQLCKITPRTVLSGPEAIELIRENQYDIVFMDHMIPGMDGIEATRIIRDMGNETPIIALTANAIAGMKDVFLAAGMNDWLTKPIEKPMLKKILADWIPQEKLTITKKHDKTVPFAKTEAEQNDDFFADLENIPGLSVQTGLGRVSGLRDVYKRSLKLAIKEIEKCKRNLSRFLQSEDMHNFSVEVHGMKGSLANLGVMELSAKAFDLETASSNGDIAFCTSNLPPFLDELNILYSALLEAFPKKEDNHEPVEISQEISGYFSEMTTALERMDFKEIDKAMEYLNSLNPDGALNEELEEIKDAVLIMNYEAAKEIIKKLTGN
jgi:CheY-like chemotaxis protein